MGEKPDTFYGRMLFRRALSHWRSLAERAGEADPASLRILRGQGRQLRRQIDRMLHVTEGRLAGTATGAGAIRRPAMADWVWRPEVWAGPVTPPGLAPVENRTEFGRELKVFHDCVQSELTIRQIRNTGSAHLAPFALRMDVFRFDGSFLSIALDLPPTALGGLTLDHIVRLDIGVAMERPLEIYARLNIVHGPNTEQIVRELPVGQDEVVAEFDLAYTRMNEKRVERAWLDLIFEGPEMNQIVIRDVTMSRRPRLAL